MAKLHRALVQDEARRKPLHQFARRFLSRYLTTAMSPFHYDFCDALDKMVTARGSRGAYIAPRDSGKSFWNQSYVLREAVLEREPYILLLSDSGDQAEKLLEPVREELETNPDILRFFPRSKIVEARRSRFVLASGVVIEGLGTGARIRGRRNRASRPTLILIDDPQGETDVISSAERQHAWDWLTRAVIPAGIEGHTNYLCVGTALHRDAIAVRLQRTARWSGQVYQSIRRWPTNMELWLEWERILTNFGDSLRQEHALEYYQSHKSQMDDGSEVLWPARRDLYALMSRRAEIGPRAFDTEDQGQPSSGEAAEWPPEYFDDGSLYFETWPTTSVVLRVMFYDSAGDPGAKPGDYHSLTSLAIDQAGGLWVESKLWRGPIGEAVAECVRQYDEFSKQGPVHALGVETNFGGSMLVPEFQRQAQAHGRVMIPVVGVLQLLAKVSRIRRIDPYLARRQLRVRNTPGGQLLVQQLRDFPFGDHDDGPDSLAGALELAERIFSGR